jgi:hypothetical protein
MLQSFFTFATESPWLTFFLFLVIGQTIIGSIKWIAYAIHGGLPSKDDDVGDIVGDDDEDDE